MEEQGERPQQEEKGRGARWGCCCCCCCLAHWQPPQPRLVQSASTKVACDLALRACLRFPFRLVGLVEPVAAPQAQQAQAQAGELSRSNWPPSPAREPAEQQRHRPVEEALGAVEARVRQQGQPHCCCGCDCLHCCSQRSSLQLPQRGVEALEGRPRTPAAAILQSSASLAVIVVLPVELAEAKSLQWTPPVQCLQGRSDAEVAAGPTFAAVMRRAERGRSEGRVKQLQDQT